MAEVCQNDYIMSIKPSPAAIASPEVDWEAVRREIRDTLDTTKGCVVELIMKDNHTLGGRPENAVRWCRIAKEEIENETTRASS